MKKLSFYLIFTFILAACSTKNPEIIVIKSKFTPSPDSVLISSPENYNNEKKYPLVILLHGYSGNYTQWNTIVNLQDYSNTYNFIIACPDGFYDSWYINNPLKSDIQFEKFFWNDFIRYLTKSYSIDRNNIFISGLSMGGHGAITLFLKNPKFFKSAGSTSGILDLTYFPDRWSIKEGIGSIKDFPEVWQSNSAYFLLDSTIHSDKKIFIDCGIEDFAYKVNLNFAKKSIDHNLDTKFISIPGDHSRKHWKKMIPQHFEFFYKQL